MTTFKAVMRTIITGHTFSNHGSTPQILSSGMKTRRFAIKEGLEVAGAAVSNIQQTFDGVKIVDEHRGIVRIYVRNSTDRDNLQADIEDMIASSSYSILIEGVETVSRRNRFEVTYRLKIING